MNLSSSGECPPPQTAGLTVVRRHHRRDLRFGIARAIDATKRRGTHGVLDRGSGRKRVDRQAKRLAKRPVHQDYATPLIDNAEADRDRVEHGLQRDLGQIAHAVCVSIVAGAEPGTRCSTTRMTVNSTTAAH